MDKDKIVLFHPYLSEIAKLMARVAFDQRFIGQGPKVDQFEKEFEERISNPHKAIAVNSGTSALHLAYILADIKDDDEVIAPVFGCSATVTPLLYQRAKIVWADIQNDTLNVNPEHVKNLITERTKAIIAVHYAGLPCDMDEIREAAGNIPIIEDAAQAIGAKYKEKYIGAISDYTAFSFQAVKLVTTCDGGMLTIKNPEQEEKAKRIRWFGIDRKAKFEDRWLKDIFEVGYKYQMTDIEATLGIEGMRELDNIIDYQKELFGTYEKGLEGIAGIELMKPKADRDASYWLCTVLVERREDLKRKLAENNIEADPVHYRLDKYTIFGGKVDTCSNMDSLEEKYLVLPMHHFVSKEDVIRICDTIKSGW